jgi:glycosyltransferase involved in cell wall biosynthesis
MSSTPLVSIVIPVYNGANYVGEAIRSALDQTYPNIEVVVVDDGSTDNGATRRVVESFGDSVRYIVKPNGGVATALNTAIANMRGELFSWLSHDDLYRRKKVARQVEAFQRFGQPCIVIGSFEVMDENGRTMYVHDIGGRNLVARPLDAVFRGLINGCALLVPRTLFNRAGLFEPGLPTTQDYHLWYRMARLVPFVHCPFADVRQRVHPLQGSRQASHLDEASRMFAHIIDSTPVRLMEAYDGSELRFLLRTRQVLSSYPGLKTYLSFRIGELMRRTSFSLVVFSDHGIDPAVVDAWLQTLTTPPAEVVSVVAEGAAAHPRFSVVSCPRFQPHDIVAAAERAAHSESVLFVNAGRLPSAGQLAAAREALVTADADVATPAGAPYALHDLDGLVVRRDALRGLWSMLQEPGFDRGGIGETMQTVSYVVTDPFGAHTNEEIERALRGDTRIDYRRGLSASGIGRILDGMLDERLPVILFVMHPHGGGARSLPPPAVSPGLCAALSFRTRQCAAVRLDGPAAGTRVLHARRARATAAQGPHARREQGAPFVRPGRARCRWRAKPATAAAAAPASAAAVRPSPTGSLHRQSGRPPDTGTGRSPRYGSRPA